jgi:hypothetical protein
MARVPVDKARQICFEIRYISLDANPWREALKHHLKLVSQETDVCSWIIDEKSISNLLELAQQDARPNDVSGPNVTSFENVHALIAKTSTQRYVAQVEKVETPARPAFRPIVREIKLGGTIDLIGSLKPGATAMTADIRDTSLLNLHTIVQTETFRDQVYSAEYQVPTIIQRTCRVSCEVPEHSAILVSLGFHERRGRLSNAGEAASGLLEAVGLPPVAARPVTCESLMMIRPRRIVLE